MSYKIFISAGGTGGHLFPAQAFAKQFKTMHSKSTIYFVAGGIKTNRYFNKEAFQFREISSSPLISKNPFRTIKGLFNLLKGFLQSMRLIKQMQPDAIVGFGSYHTLPVVLAAKMLRIPIILHEANSIPGRANKLIAPYAAAVGVHFPNAASFLKGKTFEVGLPLREGYQKVFLSKSESRDYFQLEPNKTTLLIFGGSQGAQLFNEEVAKTVANGLNGQIQVIHLTGHQADVRVLSKLYEELSIPACVKSFENKMNLAWSAADLFIGRSGASTIAEAMEFEVPGILIPYRYATDNHQEKNADFLVHSVNAGIKINENELNGENLIQALAWLLESGRLQDMQKAMSDYKRNPNRLDLCQLVTKVLQNK